MLNMHYCADYWASVLRATLPYCASWPSGWGPANHNFSFSDQLPVGPDGRCTRGMYHQTQETEETHSFHPADSPFPHSQHQPHRTPSERSAPPGGAPSWEVSAPWGRGEVLGTPALSPDSPEGSAPSSEVSGPASSRHLDSKSPAPSRGSCVPTTPPVPRGSLFSFSYEILPAKITWFCSLIGCWTETITLLRKQFS